MGHVVTFAGTKGGSGKSSLCLLTALNKCLEGHKVGLLDTDDQRSCMEALEFRPEELPFMQNMFMQGKALIKQIPELAQDYDYVFVDTGGRDTESQRSAILRSDVVVFPFAPTGVEMKAAMKINKTLGELWPANPDMQCLAILNRCDARSRGKMREAREFLQENTDLEVLGCNVDQRASIDTAVTEGMAVTEVEKKDQKAITEIRALAKAIDMRLKKVKGQGNG